MTPQDSPGVSPGVYVYITPRTVTDQHLALFELRHDGANGSYDELTLSFSTPRADGGLRQADVLQRFDTMIAAVRTAIEKRIKDK